MVEIKTTYVSSQPLERRRFGACVQDPNPKTNKPNTSMKTSIKFNQRSIAGIVAAILCGFIVAPDHAFAKAGATDPIPGTSKSGVSTGGGGGGGGRTVTPTPTPVVPPQPIVAAPLTFTAAASVNGTIPQCTGSYRIDPYYPTLSLMTVYTSPSSLNVPDGTYLYVTVNLAGGTGYPFTTNTILIAGQAGSGTLNEYVTPGTTITSVVISDATGTVIFAGN